MMRTFLRWCERWSKPDVCDVRGLALPCNSNIIYYAAGSALYSAPASDPASATVVADGFDALYSIAATTSGPRAQRRT